MDTARYLLIWFSMDPMNPESLVPIRRQIEDLIKEPQESVEIDLWLESPGGDAHAAYKLALMLRAAASRILSRFCAACSLLTFILVSSGTIHRLTLYMMCVIYVIMTYII